MSWMLTMMEVVSWDYLTVRMEGFSIYLYSCHWVDDHRDNANIPTTIIVDNCLYPRILTT